MLAKRFKVKRCQQKIEQFRQHRILHFDQKKMYAKFNGDGVRPSEVPNAEVKDFGVIFGASRKSVTEKQNG